MVLSKELLAEILQTARKGGDFAEIFIERRRTTRIGCEANKIERVISGNEQGAGIRVLQGEQTAYGYTNDLRKESLLKLADKVGKSAKVGSLETVILNHKESSVFLPVDKSPEEVSVEEKAELVKEANKAARSVDDKLVRQVIVSYGDVLQDVVIANTEGNYVEDRRTRSRLSVNVVAAQGKVVQTGFEAIGGTCGLELYEEDTPWDLGDKAAKRALLMLNAKPAPAGRMPVVLAGEAGGTMIHEACGHGLEADLVQRKLSVYAEKKGKHVASDMVTVIDDGTMPEKYGSYRFDDEGNPSRYTVMIERGYLHSYINDHLTAKKEDERPTGNGRRESYQCRPIPRMSNTYLAPGDASQEEIIRETKKGLLVRKMGGGQVNTVNGDFVFEVAEGYLIENGEVVMPVRGATITGNGSAVLKEIDYIGDDLGFSIGTCGKDGQGVPVSDAQPTIRIPELIVGGILEEEGDER